MMASGIPVYLLFVYWKNKPAFIQKALGNTFILNAISFFDSHEFG